jgi:predicted dehydrogenase
MKIGIMSFAHTHAIGYAQLLRDREDVELLVADPDHAARPDSESGGPELAAQLGVDYADSYDDLFAWHPDAVVVCSENAHHLRDVERAAAAGVHVLCEKPLATNTEDARRIVDICHAAGVRLMTAFPVRFTNEFEGLREVVRSGGLGAVLTVSGANNGQLPTVRSWFADRELAGGGAVTDHTVHIADLLFRLFPGTDALEVYATANDVLHPDRDVETAGLVSIRYSNGMTAVIDCSWSKPDHYPVWGGLGMRVVGEKATAVFSPFAPHLDGFSELEQRPTWTAFGQDLDGAMLDEFISAIRDGRQPLPSGEDGLRTVEIVEAAYASIASGQPAPVGAAR